MLDLEYISGYGGGIPLADYFYAQYSVLNFANQVGGQKGAGSLVYSVSYGNDEVQQTSTQYMYDCNTAFMTCANYGYSIMFASGDQGVWGRTGYSANGVFNPDFPATSPYITAVGGTDFTSSSPSLSNYVEMCSVDGGGGFSNTFAMPAFQSQVVKNYITTYASAMPPSNLWNSSGRAYPDVSAEFGLVVPYCILANGVWEGVAGTSASCPTFAHGISILNNIQLTANKPQLGYLNPWLYSLAGSNGFTDILTGMNSEGQPPKNPEGFPAEKGWDACSGLGTPNFANMAKLLP